MSSAAALGITGIVVSGVVGPFVASWSTRRLDRQRFNREEERRRRDDLQAVVDEGAVLLGAGETNLRLAQEAAAGSEPMPPGVDEWAGRVHLLGQRLLLRLPEDDPIVISYEAVRAALLAVGDAYGDDASYPAAVADFEQRRAVFLEEARLRLEQATKC